MKAWLIAILILVSALTLVPSARAQDSDPQAVVKALEAAANNHDLEAAVALFTDDAVIQIRPEAAGGTYTGKQQIRQWFEGLYATNFRITVNIDNVQGDTVTTRSTISSDALRGLGLVSLEGIEQYTVQNGKLTALTFTYTDESLARLQAAIAQQAAPQALPQTAAPPVLPALWLLLLASVAVLTGAALRLRDASWR